MSIVHHVAVAFASGADLVVWETRATAAERDDLLALLGNLAGLGHIVAYAVTPSAAPSRTEGMIQALEARLGSLVVHAASNLPQPSGPPPAFLMPVWPFDHELGGMPASTASFLNLDLELVATPSPNEELGVLLPTREGLWLVHARPFPT